MRYIGNKTKLLSFIDDLLDDFGIVKGRALDAFAGTASVGSYLKARGFAVAACDIMTFSYVFQQAYIVVDTYPRFAGLKDDPQFLEARQSSEFAAQVESRFAGQGDLFGAVPSEAKALEEVLVFLDTYLPPLPAFITENYSASNEGEEGKRMFFTRENAARIDAIRQQLHVWQNAGMITHEEYFVLLAALLEAADSVANTTGVYAAFVKTWQSNATKPLRLPLTTLVVETGLPCEAHQGDVNNLIRSLGHFDLLYLDPPYNTRQYRGYYHVPEVIAEGWFESPPKLRGKTGLIPDEHKKSEWSTRAGCVPALESLLDNAEATHVVMSYNNEGIIPADEIERLFRAKGRSSTYQCIGRSYGRYRSDGDSELRTYSGDSVTEFLYYVTLK